MGCFTAVELWLAKKWRRFMIERRFRRRQAESTRPNVSEAGDGTIMRVSKSGIAFNLAIDDRVPTPFLGLTPRPGSSLCESRKEKMQRYAATLARRQEQLEQKTAFARECNRKRETVRADASKSESAIYAVRDVAIGDEECLTGANSPCH